MAVNAKTTAVGDILVASGRTLTQLNSLVNAHTSDIEALEAAAPVAATETAAGIVELATSAETTAGLAVQASDTRLSNARAPTNHNHASNKLAQANTHESADTDSAITSLHHTIGTTATQAAAGNHTHLELHDAVTLAGTPDYLTISGQVITRNQVDLETDVTGALPVASISATGTPDASTYLRGDGEWATPAGGGSVTSLDDVGDVTYTGAPSDAQALVWSSGAWRNATIAAPTGSGTAVDTIAAMTAIASPTDGQLVTVRGYSATGDGGGGLFMWASASTVTANGGTIFQKDGGGTGRWLRQYSGLVSVKAFGAKGDNSANDAPAIQAAVNARVSLFVPNGTYRLSASITWPPNYGQMYMEGDTDSNFVDARGGNPQEPLFHRLGSYMLQDGSYHMDPGYEITDHENTGFINGPITLKRLRFLGTGIYGHCVEIQGARDCRIEQCHFASIFRGLTLSSVNFDTGVVNCVFEGTFFGSYPWDGTTGGESNKEIAERAWGLYLSGHKTVQQISIVGYGAGIIVNGPGNSVNGLRIEVNYYGMIVGGITYTLPYTINGFCSRSLISGISLEMNTIGVLVKSAESTLISGIAVQGSVAVGIVPEGEVGILVEQIASTCRIENCSFNGHFLRGSCINLSYNPLWFNGAGNASTGIVYGSSFGQLNSSHHYLKTATQAGTLTTFSDLMLRSLTGLNIRDTNASGQLVYAKNFGGTVTPTNGATSAAVTFSTEISGSLIAFSAIAGAADGNSLLTAGTYYYATTVVARHAECSVQYDFPNQHNYRTITIPSGQRVNMDFYGGADETMKRRIYRGRQAGWFEGYWDIAMGPSFYDDGRTAFTGKGMPPSYGNLPGLVEENADYQIIATPSWATTVFVSNKTTTGFTLNFGTAAPDANQTVSWLLFRP